MSPALPDALRHTRRLYLTTYNRQGRSGTVPIWFFLHHDRLYFCTRRNSLKVRRIQQTGRAMVHIGRRTGPRLTCTALLVESDAALQAHLLRAYRRRYWWLWLWIGPRLRRAFAHGDEVMVQLIPQEDSLAFVRTPDAGQPDGGPG